MAMKKQTKLRKPRNKLAVAAHNRSSKVIKRKPRGGAKNKQKDILNSDRVLIAIAFFGWAIRSFANKLVVQRMHPSTMQITNYAIGFLCIPVLHLVDAQRHDSLFRRH